MTSPTAADIPLSSPIPASLLPFGCATFAEQVLDSCARAGLKHIDLVVSEQPEKLRETLGEGWRWGLTLRWHLAKETSTPYGLLHSIGLQPGDRILIGHGHHWIADTKLLKIVNINLIGMTGGEALNWSGWMSAPFELIQALSPHSDYEALSELMQKPQTGRYIMVADDEYACADSADSLMQSQYLALADESGSHIPATWLRFSWGAMSPDASVDPQSSIVGPVLVGPGCMIDSEAQIGPGCVLSHDVLVARGAVIRATLILPNTYVSGSVTLDRVIVQGNSVQDLKWKTRMSLPQSDGVLAVLNPHRMPRASWIGRGLAAILFVLLWPMAVVLMVWQMLRGGGAGWQRFEAVTGRADHGSQLLRRSLRGARDGNSIANAGMGRYAALLDVAQGRRHWFGIRARDEAKWHALRRDWQVLFNTHPVGFFCAPAWTELAEPTDDEAYAAADAYFAVCDSISERWRIVRVSARHNWFAI